MNTARGRSLLVWWVMLVLVAVPLTALAQGGDLIRNDDSLMRDAACRCSEEAARWLNAQQSSIVDLDMTLPALGVADAPALTLMESAAYRYSSAAANWMNCQFMTSSTVATESVSAIVADLIYPSTRENRRSTEAANWIDSAIVADLIYLSTVEKPSP